MSKEEMECVKSKQLRYYDPELRSMARLQDQSDKLLTRKDVNPDEILKQINYLQAQFNEIKKKGNTEPELAGVSKKMDQSEDEDEEEED